MKDITNILQSYRECVRHLWNANFLALLPTAQDRWNLRDQFDEVGSVLFSALVVDRLGVQAEACSAYMLRLNRRPPSQALPWLRVVPISDHGTPIMINRDATADSG